MGGYRTFCTYITETETWSLIRCGLPSMTDVIRLNYEGHGCTWFASPFQTTGTESLYPVAILPPNNGGCVHIHASITSVYIVTKT